MRRPAIPTVVIRWSPRFPSASASERTPGASKWPSDKIQPSDPSRLFRRLTQEFEIFGFWLERQAAYEGFLRNRNGCKADICTNINVCAAFIIEISYYFICYVIFCVLPRSVHPEYYPVIPGAPYQAHIALHADFLNSKPRKQAYRYFIQSEFGKASLKHRVSYAPWRAIDERLNQVPRKRLRERILDAHRFACSSCGRSYGFTRPAASAGILTFTSGVDSTKPACC